MNYPALKTLLQAHPEITGTDDARATALNALTQIGPIPAADYSSSIMLMTCWGKARLTVVRATASDQIVTGCLLFIDWVVNFRGATLDTTGTFYGNVIDGLVTANVMTSAERTAIAALANNRASLAKALGTVTASDVATAEGRAS